MVIAYTLPHLPYEKYLNVKYMRGPNREIMEVNCMRTVHIKHRVEEKNKQKKQQTMRFNSSHRLPLQFFISIVA